MALSLPLHRKDLWNERGLPRLGTMENDEGEKGGLLVVQFGICQTEEPTVSAAPLGSQDSPREEVVIVVRIPLQNTSQSEDHEREAELQRACLATCPQ